MAAHSVTAEQEIVPSRTGREVNIFASNWWARMASLNERGLVNFLCTVFEQGDEMLTSIYLPIRLNPRGGHQTGSGEPSAEG